MKMVGEFPLRDSKKTATTGGYCEKHKDKEINYYCGTCDAAICWTCLFEEHRTHVTRSGMRNIKEIVKKEINKYVAKYADLTEGLQDQTDSMKGFYSQRMRGTGKGEMSELSGFCCALIAVLMFIYFIYFLSSSGRVTQYEREILVAKEIEFLTGKQGMSYLFYIFIVGLVIIFIFGIAGWKSEISPNGDLSLTNEEELAMKKFKRDMAHLEKSFPIQEGLWIRIGEEIVKLSRNKGTQTFSSILFYPQDPSNYGDVEYLRRVFMIAVKNAFDLYDGRVFEINQATGVYENLENSALKGKPVVLVSDELKFPLASSMAMDWFTSSRGNKPNGLHVVIAKNKGQHLVIGRDEDSLRRQLKECLFYWMLSKDIQRRLDETIVVIVPERSYRH